VHLTHFSTRELKNPALFPFWYNFHPIALLIKIALTFHHPLKRYTRTGLWSLFLITGFPIHVWTILLAFDDFAWVADRTNNWDAIGASSYEMVYAVVESVIVFLVIVALGFGRFSPSVFSSLSFPSRRGS
jgi:hypothetical protein